MKRLLLAAFFSMGFMALCAGTLYAPLVTTTEESDSSYSDSDTRVVDLSDRDTDAPVESPSFENQTPSGQAPGEPVEGY